MKTIKFNAFQKFNQIIEFQSIQQFHKLVHELTPSRAYDLFIIIYGNCDAFNGYSIVTPRSGNLVPAEKMVNHALETGADGMIIVHVVDSPRSLMHECEALTYITNLANESGILVRDYAVSKSGTITSFSDTMIK